MVTVMIGISVVAVLNRRDACVRALRVGNVRGARRKR
jgi:hypothetical protein